MNKPHVAPQGIGAFIRERLLAGDDTEPILAAVRKRFPASRAQPSDVAWNRRKLRDAGSLAPVERKPRRPKAVGISPGRGEATVRRGRVALIDVDDEARAEARGVMTLLDGPRAVLPPAKRPRWSAVGSYIFAGGFTLGMRDHFRVLAHLEDGSYGVPTFERNQPGIPVHASVDEWPLEIAAQADLIYGNPPCAAWSPLGRVIQAGPDAWRVDPRVDCVRKMFAKLLEEAEPKIWAWESVPAAFSRGRDLVRDFARRAGAAGYAVDLVLHDARYLGALQSRRRFFFIATKVEVPWALPALPEAPSGKDALASYNGSGDPELMLKEGYYPRAMLALVPKGKRIQDGWERFVAEKNPKKVPPRASFGQLRLCDYKPAGAVTGSVTIHPTENRGLTIGELAHLSGFPPSYEFVSRPGQRASLIARGVLPPVGRWLGEQLRRGLDRGAAAPAGRVRLVDVRKVPGFTQEISV